MKYLLAYYCQTLVRIPTFSGPYTGKPLVQRTAALTTLGSISVIISDNLISNKLQKKYLLIFTIFELKFKTRDEKNWGKIISSIPPLLYFFPGS